MSAASPHSQAFHDLHVKGDPVILFNIWDPGSAKIVEQAGSKALATGSAPVAMAHGFEDGENIPLDMAIDNLRRIVSATSIPVSFDLEGGYGASADAVSHAVSAAVMAGASGFNFEDQIIGTTSFYNVEDQVKRIAAARISAGDTFINARTDIFLKAAVETHDMVMLEQAIERGKAYAQAGADGFFVPGLADKKLIETLVSAIDLPINIIALPHMPDSKILASLGVARISYGPVVYRQMAAWLEAQARVALTALTI